MATQGASRAAREWRDEDAARAGESDDSEALVVDGGGGGEVDARGAGIPIAPSDAGAGGVPVAEKTDAEVIHCLLYTSPSPRD